MAKKSVAKASVKKSAPASKPAKRVSARKAASAKPAAKSRAVKTRAVKNRGEVPFDAISVRAAKEFTPTRTRSLAMRAAPESVAVESVALQSRRMDDALAARLERAADKAREKLAKNPDVLSVGTGYKVSAGYATDTPAILVTVLAKIDDPSIIDKKRLIPAEFAGFPVDVLSCPHPQVLKTVFGGGQGRTTNSDTFLGSVGTLGAVVFDTATNVACALSNEHVWGNRLLAGVYWPYSNVVNANTIIGQVARVDVGLDACLCRLHGDKVQFSRTIEGLGYPVAGTTLPFNGQIVEKSGYKTGHTFGVVGNANTSRPTISPVQGGPASVSQKGDSGAIWVERGTRLAVGLHRAGDGISGQMVPIGPVLTSLKVRF